jgi:hypothetical protein
MPALPNEDDPEIPEDRVLNATPDPILDEPEWGTKKDAPRFSGKSVPRVWGESEPFTRRFNNESGTLKNS